MQRLVQEGVVNEAAAEKSRAVGLAVVMDRCILKEHRKLGAQRTQGERQGRKADPW